MFRSQVVEKYTIVAMDLQPYESYLNKVALDFLDKPFHLDGEHQPKEILFMPCSYYASVPLKDYPGIFDVTLYDKDKKEINTFEWDSNQSPEQSEAIFSIEEYDEKEAQELRNRIYDAWRSNTIYETSWDLASLMKERLPEDIKKTKYVAFEVVASGQSESVYLYLTEDQEWADDPDYSNSDGHDLKIRISSHDRTPSSNRYARADETVDVTEEDTPEGLYQKVLDIIK